MMDQDKPTKAVEGMCCDCAEGGPCCYLSENEDCPSRKEDGSCWRAYTESEAPMEKKDKPLSDRTIGDVIYECKSRIDCGGCPFSVKRCGETMCRLDGVPSENWDLAEQPRFTEEEIVVLRYFAECLHIAHIARRKDGGLFGGEGPFKPDSDGFITDAPIVGLQRTLFPSLRPGQSIALEEIIG